MYQALYDLHEHITTLIFQSHNGSLLRSLQHVMEAAMAQTVLRNVVLVVLVSVSLKQDTVTVRTGGSNQAPVTLR